MSMSLCRKEGTTPAAARVQRWGYRLAACTGGLRTISLALARTLVDCMGLSYEPPLQRLPNQLSSALLDFRRPVSRIVFVE
jgi:hypothetical protein